MRNLYMRFLKMMSGQHDISEHLGLLKGLASDPEVRRVVEIGFRTGVSATALLAAGNLVTCYDIESCTASVKKLRAIASNFQFIKADSLKVTIPLCELLHIDGEHTYRQLSQELRRHSPRVSKWIAMHDTETFALKGKDDSTPGLHAAIHEFLRTEEGLKWKILLSLRNNNGMTVIERTRQ